MRTLIALLALASPAAAWEAYSIGPVCYLDHQTDDVDVSVTYDPLANQAYSIRLTRKDTPWDGGPLFAMEFIGSGALTITTNRQVLSDGGHSLSVADTGFGNVLRGLAFNDVAMARLGDQALTLPLAGAAPEVDRFNACTTAPSA